MNNWTGSGFISRDIDVKDIQTKSGETMKMARFSIACQRKGKNAGADFVGCVAYGKNAETLEKYFSKGRGIEVRCHVQTGSYEGKNGKVYTTDLVVDEIEFPKVRKADEQNYSEPQESEPVNEQPQAESAPDNSFMDIPDGDDDDLPFRK
jgi:single-strand DNA-binding protein